MITIFSTCKPFGIGLNTSNQVNAILSWQELTDDVILFGKEHGIAEVANELGVCHIPEVGCNEWGTPLIPNMFSKVREIAKHGFFCYVNADIILPHDFVSATKCVAAELSDFLMIGRRWNLIGSELLSDLSQIREAVDQWGGWKKPTGGSDYFVWPKQVMDTTIPPIVVGTRRWDLWMIGNCLQRGIPVVDVTKSVQVIHQWHREWPRTPDEVRRNVQLVGRTKATVADADWELTPKGLREHG